MNNTTFDWKQNRRDAVGAWAGRNNTLAINRRAIGAKALPAKASRPDETSANAGGGAPAGQALAMPDSYPMAPQAMPWLALPGKSILLQDAEKGLFAEKCVYLILTATVAASLLMAYWQLRSLEAGWASFVDLVGRIVS